ncbi:MAG: hypothetical protein IID17_13175 [Nitrospinae bacterium]|nr:hypothetical protein [Nitrospinota bacterium]
MSAEWDEFYDPLFKKECWTIEEVRTMLFPGEFWDEGEIYSPSRVFNGKIPLWSIGSELISRALAKGTIICLGNSSSGPEHCTQVTRESVVGWIEFHEIFEWLESRGWEKPKQLDALIKALKKTPLNGTQIQMKKQIVRLKKENEELKTKNEEQKEKVRNHPIRFRDGQIRILEGALKMVNKTKEQIFRENGNLIASQLATLVNNFRRDSGLKEDKPSYENIKNYLEIALRPPAEKSNDDMRYDQKGLAQN